jgi:hypothetical protein
VHREPSEASARIGTIARDVRVGWREVVVGPDCGAGWVAIEPRGWVCGDYLEPSERAPWGRELPAVAAGAVVPGAFGKVATVGAPTFTRPGLATRTRVRTLEGAVKVRREAAVTVAGVDYWRIDRDEYIAAASLRPLEPSRWHGVRLGDDTGRSLPLGFAFSREARGRDHVPVFAAPDAREAIGSLPPRAVVAVVETARSADGAAHGHRIGEHRWVRAHDLRLAELKAAPPQIGPLERWVDIDLDRQVLVAYEGERPVYATLVSSGSGKYPSATGVFRMFAKLAETDMNGQMGDEAPYSVATVPWTQFYSRDLALHTSYWHDRFGEPRSHGCINLAPIDARFLYFWSEPSVPPGWSAAFGVVEAPGSLVRVRSAADPEPGFRGYAERVRQARLAGGASPR